MIDIKRGFSVMIGGMENRDEKVKSFAEDRFTRKNGIGKRMIECGRIEK